MYEYNQKNHQLFYHIYSVQVHLNVPNFHYKQSMLDKYQIYLNS